MAKSPDAPAPAIDPAKRYRIKLARTVFFMGGKMMPRDEHIVLGSVIAEFGDAVISYEPVE